MLHVTKVKSKELVAGPGREYREKARVSYLRSSYECTGRYCGGTVLKTADSWAWFGN